MQFRRWYRWHRYRVSLCGRTLHGVRLMESVYCRVALAHAVLDVRHIGAFEQLWYMIIHRNGCTEYFFYRFIVPSVAPLSCVLSFTVRHVRQLNRISNSNIVFGHRCPDAVGLWRLEEGVHDIIFRECWCYRWCRQRHGDCFRCSHIV